jgi:CRISPR-associated protein Cas1
MSDNIVEIGNPARLSVRDAQLVIEREGFLPFATPVSGVTALLLAHPQVTLTQAVFSRLAEAGAIVVTIDSQYRPAAMSVPLQANTLQSERIAAQASLSPVRRKQLWTQIVKAKIRSQANLLRELYGSDGGLEPMRRRVRSGDPDNMEAQAARRYWGLIFDDKSFRRGAEQEAQSRDQNRHLDYGYTVLRATVARALCATGLHPSLGLRHHNRYDPFCLVADLMEPFRPLIDRRVVLWVREHDPSAPLDSPTKKWLIQGVTMRYLCNGEQRAFPDIVARAASSLAAAIVGQESRVELPEALGPCPDE